MVAVLPRAGLGAASGVVTATAGGLTTPLAMARRRPLGHPAGGLRGGDPLPAVVSSGDHTVMAATTTGLCRPVGVPLAVGRLWKRTRRSRNASS